MGQVQRPRSHYDSRSDAEIGLLSTGIHHTVHGVKLESLRMLAFLSPPCRSIRVVILTTGYPVFIEPQLHTVCNEQAVQDNILIMENKPGDYL